MPSESGEFRVPIIKLYRNLIVVVQGALSDAQVAQLQSDVTFAIERYDAQGLVLSVAGVDLMDSYISRAIYDLAVVAKLMGVESVVCGIQPMVAITLVEMGLGLGNIPTELNLERALEYLEEKCRDRIGEHITEENPEVTEKSIVEGEP